MLEHHYSSLSDYWNCNYGYKLKHIDKVIPREDNYDALMGSGVHFAIKSHYEGSDAVSVFRMFWNSIKNRTGVKQNSFSYEELGEMGEKFLSRFVSKYAHKFEPVHAEKFLVMPFASETLGGTLDFIATYEGKLTLIDFKTSGQPYKRSKLLCDPQLYTYVLLAEAVLNIKIEQIMYFVFVKSTGNIQTNQIMSLDRERLSIMRSTLEDTIKDISDKKVWPRNPACKFCVCGFDKEERS